MHHPHHNSGNSFFAFLIGAVAGAVLGMLYAPKSGEKTREDLQKAAKRAKRELTEKAGDFRDRTKEFADNARQGAKEASEAFKRNMEK